MRTRITTIALLLLLCPLWALAQYWESGTLKTNNFFNYKSGGNTYSKTEVSYLINSEQDGKMEFSTVALGDVRITSIALYAVEDDELLRVANGYQSLTVEDVAAGLYRVIITGQPTDKGGQGGNFQAGYVLTPADYVNDPEPNNTWERAYQIESGNPQHGHLGYKRAGNRDEEDWFKIVVPDEGSVTFTTHANGKLRLYTLGMYVLKGDSTGVDFRCDKNMDGGGKDTTIVYTVPDCKPGTYYIRLRRGNYYGSYKLTYQFTASSYGQDNPDNDTWDKAKDLALNISSEGRLGYNFHNNTDVEDWYKIVVPDEGKLTFTTKSETTLRLYTLGMYTPNGESTDVNFRNDKNMDGGAKDTTVVYEVPDCKPGTYYVRLRRGSGYGGYQLINKFTANAYGADAADNETWDKAQEMALDTPTDGRLGYNYHYNTDAEDWFKIEVPEEGKLTFTTKSDPTLRLYTLGMYTPNADNTGVNFRNDKNMDGANRDTTVVYEVPDVSIGTYYIRLRRGSGYGGYRLNCYYTSHADEADPEPNDTWQEAMPLKSGPTVTGQLGYNYHNSTDTEDWYKIDVPKEGSVVFSTKTETTLRLYTLGMYTLNGDSTGVNFRNDKNMDGGGIDTTVVYEVPDCKPGTYYIRLRRGSGYGTYALQYVHNPNAHVNDPEPNDSWESGTVIESGTTQEGCLGYNFHNNTDVEDWFKIVLPDEGKVTFAATAETTLRLYTLGLYVPNGDGTGTVFRCDKNMDAGGKDTTVVYEIPDCKPGTYYVRLRIGSGYGGYNLDYTFTPNSHGQDNLDNDTWDKANLIENNTMQPGRLGYNYHNNTDGYDWFKIELPDEGKVTFAATAETTLRLYTLGLYVPKDDGTGVDFRCDKNMDAANKDTTIVYEIPDCKPGLYYVCLRLGSGYGGYDLDYTFTPNSHGQDNLDNDTWDKATVIENHTTQPGRLGYNYHNNTDGYDWFKIVLPDEGKVTFAATAETTLRLYTLGLYVPKADGTGVDFRQDNNMDGGGKDTTVVYEIPDCKPGIYYVCLRRGSGYGGYNLDYTFTPNVYGPDFADNDTWDKASVIEIGTNQNGRLGYNYHYNTDTEDWFKIELPYVGNVTFSATAETTLRLYTLGLYLPNVDGSDVSFRNDKNMDGGGKDTTVVYSMKGLGAGTYYVRLRRGSGYGGYALKYEYERNPWDRDNLQNHDFANRYLLTEGQTVSTTLGYTYRTQNNEDWYDLGMLHGRQIDVTIVPDTTRTLVIGVPTLYIYKGDKEDGSPILQSVAESRIERSQGTISYIDKNDEPQHYVFRVPNYNGSSYGGYRVTFGNDQPEGTVDIASTSVSVMTQGRNTVRKGVPCENPITITNTSATKTGKFLVTVAATDNIDIIGFRMPGNRGQQYLPVDSVTVLDGANCQHTVTFLVPSLDPWESYTFTMISEGKGDIAYSRNYQEFHSGANKIVVNNSTYAVVAVLGNVAGADKQVFVNDYIVHRLGDLYDLTGEQRLKVSQLIDQLESEKQQTGVAAFSVLSLLKRASELCGMDLIDASCPIATLLRERILWWIYQDEQYTPGDDILDIIDGKAAINDVVASWDPNEMRGPQGVGEEHYLGETQTVNYRILFENKAEAGDAAYRVRISDELDENVFDVSTVRFGETSHDGIGYNWVMKREGNKLSWDIEGIELPPNVNAPEGEGYVSFSVDLKPGLADGTKIKNKAEIIFDKNFPIETNEFVNTLDLTAPTTTMAAVSYVAEPSAMRVTFSATDAASGVQSYLLFVSEDGGDYSYYGQSVTPQIDYPVASENGRTYSFFVLATDNVGNTERIQPQSVEGKATGISAINRETITNNRCYDMQGRRIESSMFNIQSSMLKKGVYIINNRKFVVK